VLRVPLPADVRRAMASASPSSSPSASSSPSTAPGTATDDVTRSPWPWAIGGVLALVALLVLLRALRPR
jgi:hypothetical protein